MVNLDLEEYVDSDPSDNEEQHSQLLSSVSQLDSNQRVKPASRKEISSEVCEYNLIGKKNVVNVKQLAHVLYNKSKHAAIAKKLKKVTENSKTLPKPLEKPVEEKIKRSVGFENVKKQLRRWNAIVARNSLKDHITFPLNKSSLKLSKSNEFLSQFKTATPLEMEIAQVLKEETKGKKEEEEEKDKEFPLTLKEMREKRKEMAQLRAKLSYREAKAQRQSKIKSKKYHRILQREKLRQQLKEFELLQKTDPEAALKKLSELDKSRAQERASLRHRNTGQWAKNMTVRAKYNIESRKVLAEQLKMSREITQKVHKADSSDDEDAAGVVAPAVSFINQELSEDKSNPWTVKVSNDVKNFISDYKKYWNEQNKKTNQSQLINEKNIVVNTQETNETLSDKNKNNEILSNEEIKLNKKQTTNEKNIQETNETLSDKNKSNEIVSNEEIKLNKKQSKNEKNIQETNETLSDKNKNNKILSNEEIKLNKTESVAPPVKTKSSIKKPTKSGANNNKKTAPPSKKKKEEVPSVSIQPTSGVWIVTPVVDENISKPDESLKKSNENKRKMCDIETLFEDLNDKLMSKAAKKAKRIKKKLKATEKQKKKQERKQNENEEIDLTLKNPDIIERPDLDVGLIEGGEEETKVESNGVIPDTVCSKSAYNLEIDPKNFIQVNPKKLQTHLPKDADENPDALDDEEAHQMMMEEAFGDDDIFEEFKDMKKKEEESSKVEITTSLPGWGTWGGTGIKPNPRKTRRFILNLPERKDKKLKEIIICENENPKLKDHLVKEVPHPFKSVEAFEANIRAPVGRDWLPETAHRKLIQKQVETQMGAVIQPMDENEIVRRKKQTKSPYVGKKKNTK